MSMWDGLYGVVDVRRVQPYDANKVYICPGCNQDIPVGMGHYVCVPADAVDLNSLQHDKSISFQRRLEILIAAGRILHRINEAGWLHRC